MSSYAAVFSKASRSASGYRGATGRFGGTFWCGKDGSTKTHQLLRLKISQRKPGSQGRWMDPVEASQRCLRREFHKLTWEIQVGEFLHTAEWIPAVGHHS